MVCSIWALAAFLARVAVLLGRVVRADMVVVRWVALAALALRPAVRLATAVPPARQGASGPVGQLAMRFPDSQVAAAPLAAQVPPVAPLLGLAARPATTAPEGLAAPPVMTAPEIVPVLALMCHRLTTMIITTTTNMSEDVVRAKKLKDAEALVPSLSSFVWMIERVLRLFEL